MVRVIYSFWQIGGVVLCCLLALKTIDADKGVKSRITLNTATGRYDNILISIDEDVEQTNTLINSLQSLYSQASKTLKTATINRYRNHNGGMTFGKVYILLPETWNPSLLSQPVHQALKWQLRENAADIVIVPDVVQPHTKHKDGCGKPGEHTIYPTSFIEGIDLEVSFPEKIVVQEWAKLRWGVFSETPLHEHEHFYFQQDGQLQPNTCSVEIEGKLLSNKHGTCIYDERDKLKYCRFEPYKDKNDVKHSFMAYTEVKSIIQFCDDHNHNSLAKTQFQRVCGYRSVWSVLDSHSDFSSHTTIEKSYKNPEFVLIQEQPATSYLQLIFDSSGSMVGHPMDNLKNALTEFIKIIDDTYDMSIGFVTFTDSPQTLLVPKQNSATTRKELLRIVSQLQAGGGTALSDGVMQAFKDVGGDESNPLQFSNDAIFLLLSDGQENSGRLRIPDIIPIFEKAQVEIHPISYGPNVPPNLKDLAKSTGGKERAVETTNINDLLSALIQILNSRIRQRKLQVVTVTRGSFPAPQPGSTVVWEGFLDSSLGQSTTFYFTFASTPVPQIQVESPTGQIYNRLNGSDIYVENQGKINVHIPEIAESGKWAVHVLSTVFSNLAYLPGNEGPKTSSAPPLGNLLLMSKPPVNSTEKPVKLSASMSQNVLNKPSTDEVHVHVSVERGSKSVLGAQVTLNVDSVGVQDHFSMLLRDNGVGADAFHNDGIYTGVIVESMFKHKSLYKLDAKIKYTGTKNETNDSSFERALEVGALHIKDPPPGGPSVPPKIPPGQIRDVNAQVVDAHNQTVQLEWTALGAEGDRGNVAKYTIKVQPSPDFGNTTSNVYSFEIVTPNWTPRPPFERENVILKIIRLKNDTETFDDNYSKDQNKTADVFVVFFTIQPHGPNGLTAPSSMPVSVSFSKPRLPKGINPPPSPPPPKSQKTPSPTGDTKGTQKPKIIIVIDKSWYIWLSLVVTTVCIVTLLASFVIARRQQRNHFIVHSLENTIQRSTKV